MNSPDTIEPDELKRRIANGESFTIIDVREDEEVAQGRIPGARHIALGEIPERYKEIPQEGEVILVCRSGNRSGRAMQYLQSLGYGNLRNMAGGMLAWDQLD